MERKAIFAAIAAMLLSSSVFAQAGAASGAPGQQGAPCTASGQGCGGYPGKGPGMGGGHGMGPGMMGGGPGMMGDGMMGGRGMMGERGMGDWGMGEWGMGGHGMIGGGPGIYEQLDLTDEQRTKIADIRHEQWQKRWTAMGQMHDLRWKLARAGGDVDDATLMKNYDAMAALHRQIFQSSLEARKRIEQILTPEQREKLKASRSRR